jgi:hypothetical protein
MTMTCVAVAVNRPACRGGYAFADQFHSPELTRDIIGAKLKPVKDTKVSSNVSERQLFKGKLTNRVLALYLLA